MQCTRLLNGKRDESFGLAELGEDSGAGVGEQLDHGNDNAVPRPGVDSGGNLMLLIESGAASQVGEMDLRPGHYDSMGGD